ncbi:YidC/Oxa1 family membrane protein insertase [Lachnospiraceae bacterium 50-23]|jgi:YidC/Oxa1 family membrane protein insertase|nr:YidC/Oxa1 family membrane protein insertase [Dorea sp.]
MVVSLLSAANWPIVGQICWLLGKVMNFIYTILDNLLTTDNGLVGLSIIIYTILVYMCMLPMTINQQKSSKMMAVINPEVQAIQKKYRNKKDQASMMKQQEEIQQVYDKYGTSMMGGCLPMLIQMPFLFALYPVIYNIEAYVPAIKNAPDAVNRFITIPDLTVTPIQMIKNSGSFGMPSAVIIITAILIPVISGATQFLSIKLSQSISENSMDKNNPMASTMKSMNISMPLLSVFMVFSFPTGIGVYWVISAVVRCIQQVFINKHLSKMSVEDLIEKNKEKAEKKRKKRGEKAERINAMAQTNTRSIKDSANRQASGMSEKEKEAKIEKARKNAKEGSLAAKANMVKKFNENN